MKKESSIITNLYYSLLLLVPLVTVGLFTKKPFFAYMIDTPKWIVLFGSAFLYLCFFLLERRTLRFLYPQGILPFVAMYTVGFTLVLLGAPRGNTETIVLRYVLFFVLAYWGYQIFTKNKNFFERLDLWNILTVPVILLPTLIVVVTVIVQGAAQQRALPFFGSPAMMSEYLGFSWVLQFYALQFGLGSPKVATWFRWALLGVTSLLILLCESRAIILALILSGGFLLALKHLSKSHRPRGARARIFMRPILLGGFILLGAFAWYRIQTSQGRAFTYNKTQSANARLIMWQNTIEMIRTHPFGVGLGNFAAAYNRFQNAVVQDTEFSERGIIANPHNSFLELAAENGVLCALAFLGLLVFFLRRLVVAFMSGSSIAALAVGCMVFLGVDGFFNFPQDTPYTFFCMSLTCALLFRECGNKKFEIKGQAVNALIMGAWALYLGIVPYRFYLSEHLTYTQRKSPESLYRACELDPQNWRACLVVLSLDWEAGKKEEALTRFEKLSQRFPGHFPIRKKGIELLWLSGKHTEACREMKSYDDLFQGRSSLSRILKERCH